MKKALLGFALAIGAVLGATLGFGGGVPFVPSSPQYNEPSQIVSTLNAFINQLNGNPLGQGGYAAQPGGVVSLNSPAQCASGASPVTCTGAAGKVNITGNATLTTGSTETMQINNTTFTAASICQFTPGPSSAAAGSAPFVAVATPGAGNYSLVVANAGTTATGAAWNFTVYWNCIN